LEEHTLVFFLSDNGGPEQANASSNGPLRAGKATTYEGGIRVPFLVHWKGKLPAGKTYDPPVIQLDIVPTALAAAGVKIDPQARLDGVDLLPYLRGDKAAPPHDALYWRFGPQLAIRMGDWKLVKGRDPNVRQPLRRGQADLAGAMLFNLANDPGEQRNLAAEMPQKVKELEAAWQIWNAQLKAPSWGPPDRQPAAQPAP
jgi:arylsulfatase A-like enzyme